MMSVVAAALALTGALGGLVPAVPFIAPQKFDVEVSVVEKRVPVPTEAGFTYIFQLSLRNLTDKPQLLVRYDYRVAVEDTEYLQLQTDLDQPIRIEPQGETMISLPVKMTYEYLFPAVPGLRERDGGVCYVSGGMTFRDDRRREKRVPIAFSGEFPIFRGFQGRVAPVEVQALTIGGAELTMTVVFKNLNGFPVTLDRFAYKLELAGRTVNEGTFRGEAKVEAKGEAVFAVPLVLDFFEIGKTVYNGLEQPPVAVRLSGEALVTTPWGPWQIPIDQSDKVAVQKKSSRPLSQNQ